MKLKRKSNFRIGVLPVLVVLIFALSVFQLSAQLPNPPVPIKFTLDTPGYVTLVIERPDGVRVRNLISETWFPAGENTVMWDGLDDLGRDNDAASHGVYRIPSHFVDPGNYRVRGLVRGEIKPIYEFSVYNTGNPPWLTLDHTGAWLANHTPPMAALFVPAKQSPTGSPVVMLGCYVTEGPDGMAWVDLDGNKLGGKRWIGGNWTAAPYMAIDAGEKAIEEHRVYVASVWETGKKTGILELRVTALTSDKDKPIIKHVIGTLDKATDSSRAAEIGGLAVKNGIVVVSLPLKNKLVFVDAKEEKVIGDVSLPNPKGLAFDAEGRLIAISGKSVVRFSSIEDLTKVSSPKTIISDLSEPCSLTIDEGNLYISDRGQSHQVKIFTAKGKFIRSIGGPGVPSAGPYDPLHMNNPAGLAIDSRKQLWVTEEDYLPKRVSVWTLDGKLIKAFYGPAKYGGGGTLDPQDRTKFYYADEFKGAMEFKLDWEKGTSQLTDVYYRVNPEDIINSAFRSAAPETPIYYNGRRYFTNCYNSSPTNGHPIVFLFAENNGKVKPVAAMGGASKWEILKSEEFKKYLPEGVDLDSRKPTEQSFFIWCDLNNDSKVQPLEVQFKKGTESGVTIMNDLSFCISRTDGQAFQYRPTGFTAEGYPQYQISNGEVLAKGVFSPGSTGGRQVLADESGWTIVSLGVEPFAQNSLCGVKDGIPKWSYPNVWPGMHAAHRAPKPEFPGELIGPTRLLGSFIEMKNSDVGKLWAINGNHGNFYLFTIDGLFVATLFDDMRVGERWKMPSLDRGEELKGITLGGENFWPTITKTSDGNTYLVDGRRSAIVKLEGLENIHRLPDISISLTGEDIEKCRAYLIEIEKERQLQIKDNTLKIEISKNAPKVDGDLAEWSSKQWAEIDKSGVKAWFNANSKPYDINGSVTIAGDRLYIAYQTGDENLLKNSGEMPLAPFKTGGALDLMIGTKQDANPDRHEPVPGDLRLLVTMAKGKPWALLYRAVVDGTNEGDKVPFASPSRTITFDRVEDVSDKILLAGKEGNYEVSIPLATLGLNAKEGITLKGDIGVLKGDSDQTMARMYWFNKATGITADVPSEAMLTPRLWGNFTFVKGSDSK